jgi:hypothetical protein
VGAPPRAMPSNRQAALTNAPLAEAGRAFDQLSLFRPEAMTARRTGWLGRPQVGQPWPVRAVAAGGLATAAALAGLQECDRGSGPRRSEASRLGVETIFPGGEPCTKGYLKSRARSSKTGSARSSALSIAHKPEEILNRPLEVTKRDP